MLLLALLLLPIVHAPFFGDDMTGSEIEGYFRLSGESLWSLFADTARNSVVDQGRPQLLIGILGNPVFALLGDHPGLYHLYLLALTVLDGALLYLLLRRIGWSTAAAALAIVLAGGLMQLRIYHDSLLSYGALIQILFALTLISALLFLRWMREGRTSSLIWALAVFLVCPLIYEVAYTFVAVHVALAFTEKRGRAAVKAAAPFVLLAGAFVVASYVLRLLAPASIEDYRVGGGPWTTVRTYFIQLFPPLPVTNLLFDPGIGGGPTPAELAGSLWRGVAVAAAVAATALVAARRAVPLRNSGAVALGVALWVAPPALLSVAPKYQSELTPGKGYLPVLMQVFGIAILLVALLLWVLPIARARSRAMLAATIAFAAALAGLAAGATAFNNLRIVATLQPEVRSRALVEHAAERHAFDAAPDRTSVVFWDRDLAWIGPVPFQGYPYPPLMLADKTGRAYDTRLRAASTSEPKLVCPRAEVQVQDPCAQLSGQASWVRVRLRGDGGTVVVAPFTPGPNGRPERAETGAVLRVYREARTGSPGPTELRGTTPDGEPWTSAGASWRKLDGEGDWALYEVTLRGSALPRAASLDDPRAKVDWTLMPAPPQRVRLFGARDILP